MIPNEADSFIVDEMKERLAQGLTGLSVCLSGALCYTQAYKD